MSFFGSIGQAIGNPGGFWGTNDIIGTGLNDITGVTNSARQQYQYNTNLQGMAQNFNSAEAQKERNWQTDMSNSAHQRAVADLQAAGINPVLAAGSPASSGAGAAATSPGGSTGAGTSAANPIQAVLNAITTAKDVEKTDAEIDKLGADTQKALKEAGYKQKEIDYYMKHGVFPGATTNRQSSGGMFGFNGSSSETIPVGLKNNTNSARSTKTAEEQRKEREKNDKLIEKHEKHKKEMGGWWY